MELDPERWYVAQEQGVRTAPMLVTDVRLLAPASAPVDSFEDLGLASDLGLIQVTGKERLGAVSLRAADGAARRVPPSWFTPGALVSDTPSRVRIRYLIGLRDPQGATGLTVRAATRSTIRAIPGVPSFKTDDELTAWLDDLERP